MTVALGWNGQSGFCSANGKYGIFTKKPNLTFPFDVLSYEDTVGKPKVKIFGGIVSNLSEDEINETDDYARSEATNDPSQGGGSGGGLTPEQLAWFTERKDDPRFDNQAKQVNSEVGLRLADINEMIPWYQERKDDPRYTGQSGGGSSSGAVLRYAYTTKSMTGSEVANYDVVVASAPSASTALSIAPPKATSKGVGETQPDELPLGAVLEIAHEGTSRRDYVGVQPAGGGIMTLPSGGSMTLLELKRGQKMRMVVTGDKFWQVLSIGNPQTMNQREGHVRMLKSAGAAIPAATSNKYDVIVLAYADGDGGYQVTLPLITDLPSADNHCIAGRQLIVRNLSSVSQQVTVSSGQKIMGVGTTSYSNYVNLAKNDVVRLTAIGKDGIYMCWAVEYLGKSNNP